jgi:hypothetical protein
MSSNLASMGYLTLNSRICCAVSQLLRPEMLRQNVYSDLDLHHQSQCGGMVILKWRIWST